MRQSKDSTEASRHRQRHRRKRRSCWLELGWMRRMVGSSCQTVPQTLQLQEEAEVVAGALGVQQEQVGMMWM
jgi:hypothetical protein